MSNEDAAVGLLVVQGRRLGAIPGKVPEAAAPLTRPGHGRAAASAKFQPVNGTFNRSLAHDA
jgi:hypothetical protein